MKKYNLDLTAATFIILDSNEASMEVKIKNKNVNFINLFQIKRFGILCQKTGMALRGVF